MTQHQQKPLSLQLQMSSVLLSLVVFILNPNHLYCSYLYPLNNMFTNLLSTARTASLFAH